ncbi:metallo-beta-lactamase superfamily enzyme [Shewanella psychrophila]|uniref:Metallo-beta-lactamase superfamily enzyme n=1 Tax=Shewanella psychrophila TaxID=225848 RepID=A0A1S6HUT3_9GAMM|nr:MBL fold metallo-hydrolase [Shewanella psychrophila]AQS39242.1 metallo-beta-lactamase superfamily enzyme [Shewanella psychrophila]
MNKCAYFLLIIVSYIFQPLEVQAKDFTQVSSLKVTTLSTMLASRGIGEWGYAALIEVDGKKILLDTGNRPETVLQNAKDLDVDLSDVEDVILSHNHGDHIGGLIYLPTNNNNNNNQDTQDCLMKIP